LRLRRNPPQRLRRGLTYFAFAADFTKREIFRLARFFGIIRFAALASALSAPFNATAIFAASLLAIAATAFFTAVFVADFFAVFTTRRFSVIKIRFLDDLRFANFFCLLFNCIRHFTRFAAKSQDFVRTRAVLEANQDESVLPV